MKFRPILTSVSLLVFAAGSAQAIQLGLLDDFEAGPEMCTTDGWQESAQSPNPPTALVGCGELESCCLQDDSSGGFGPGSKQVVYNEAQWTGDYVTAGVNKIQLQAANPSATETLHLRVGVTNGSTCYVSSTAAVLAPATPGPDGLQFLSFFLDESEMTEVGGNLCGGGGQSLSDVLAGVTQLRILSAALAGWDGDGVVSTMQIDAIQSKADNDLDGVNNDVDNCTDAVNPDQLDTDEDGFGNECDADLNNDCDVNFLDLGIIKEAFFSEPGDANYNADANLTGDVSVNFLDLGRMKATFFNQAEPGPGPGLGACGECLPPDALGDNGDFAGLPMFMRGGLVLDWGVDPAINGFSDQTGGLYVTRFEANAGAFEWKVADDGWSIEYCSDTNLVEGVTTTAPLVGCAFPANGTIDIAATGCYEFRMQTDGNVPPLSVDLEFNSFN